MTDKPDYEAAMEEARALIEVRSQFLHSVPDEALNLAHAFIEQAADLTSLRSRVDRVAAEMRRVVGIEQDDKLWTRRWLQRATGWADQLMEGEK